MRIQRFVLSILIIFILGGNTLLSEVPNCINYQGYLENAAGEPASDGIYKITFQIYGSAAGSDLLWNSGKRDIQITEGIFDYILGSNTPLPDDLFAGDTTRYLGITIESDPELTPRTRLMSASYAHHASIADNLTMPATFDGDGHFTGDLTVDGNIIASGLGDITQVDAGSGLSGGGMSGSVELYVPNGGITSSHIQNGTIVSSDISATAEILPTKIAGTAAVLDDVNTFENYNYFNGELTMNGPALAFRRDGYHRWRIRERPDSGLIFYQVYDDDEVLRNINVLELSNYGTVGIGGVEDDQRLRIEWNLNGTAEYHGQDIEVINQDHGPITGLNIHTEHSTPGLASNCYGVHIMSRSDGSSRYGVYSTSETKNYDIATGRSYGIHAYGYDGFMAYGVYANAQSALTNWAGYFLSDVRITGTIDNSKSTIRIDHPGDPENKVLEHALMASPEMMNVYSGNIKTDAEGIAIVQLPEYFESLNRDFRYQLTVMGSFAQAIIKEKISNNQFVVATSEPNIEVSWQVTGVRKDAFAEANPVTVESEKTAEERGYYINPKAFGFDNTKSTEYATNPDFRKEVDERSSQK